MKKFLVALLLTVPFLSLAGQKPVEITAKSWIVSSQGQILRGKNTTEVRSIASITKLMTVMVYLDAYKSLNLKIDQNRVQRALVSSDNRAAKELCESYPGGHGDCIFMMNFKAKEMGLHHTNFFDATGLSVFNYSNTEDLVKIVDTASTYPEIVEASRIKKHNTNPTISKYDYTISKTGYINVAGGCVVAKVKDKIVVILGSKNVRTRFVELEQLLRA